MADFKGTVLTQKGRNLLSKAQTGATLTFTKIKIGDGTWDTNTDPTQLNDLVSTKLTLPIQSIQVVGDGTVRLRFVLTNTSLSQGFFMREIGIYAQDPDLGEILYAVAYASDRADFIPADGVTKVENVVDIYTVIANTQNVTAVISDTVVIATKQDVDNLNTQLTNQINTVNTQLTNQVNTVKPELGATAPSLTYEGKLWLNTNTNFLQYFDGSNWQNVMVSNADTVDSFHASQTPSANTIPVADVTGKISPKWIDVYSLVPYWKVSIDETSGSRTTPKVFTVSRVIKYMSYGAIFWHIDEWGPWSTLWEMKVKSPTAISITGKIGWADDNVYIYLNNNVVVHSIKNVRFTLNLVSGENLIQIVHNNSGGTTIGLDLEIDFDWRVLEFVPI